MAVQTVFSNNLDPSQPNLSNRFTNATAFLIDLPLNSVELSIDCFLQVYIPTASGELARNLPLGKIEEQAIFLNQTDTETILPIPLELQHTGLEMALLFLASDNTYLEAFIIQQDYDLPDIFTAIDNKLNLIITELNIPVTNNPTIAEQEFFLIN